MFRFARPEMLNLLWLLPVIAAAFWWGRRQARARLAALVGERLSDRLTAGNSGLKSGLAVGLVLAAWACLAVGLARPQTALAVRHAAFPGLDVILVVDVSRSMDATDMPPSRLGRAQQALFYLAETLRGNRFGLLPFAGTAFLTCPLTRDQSAVQLLIDHLETSWSPIPGTDLTQALALAREAFERTGAKHRVLVVVSDGENFGGKPLPVVKQANKEGIRTYCLGVGTEAGAAVPGEKNAVTKLDEESLKRIALIGGGTYQRLSAGGREEEALTAELKRLEKIEIFTAEQNAWQDHYPLAALAAAFLLWLELLLGRRREGPNWRQLALKIWRWIVPAAIVLFAAAPAWASARRQVNQGVAAYERQDFKRAEQLFNQARESGQLPALVEYNLGCALLAQHQYLEAYRAFERAQPQAKGRLAGDVWYNLGYTSFYVGIKTGTAERWTEAVEAFKRCLLLDPEDDDARYNLELILREIQKHTRQAAPQEQQSQASGKGKDGGADADRPGQDRQPTQGRENEKAPPSESQQETKQRQAEQGKANTSEEQSGRRQKGMSKEDALRTLRSLDAEQGQVQKNWPQDSQTQSEYQGPGW